MAYSRAERRLARLLESTPRLHAFARAGWQRLNYLLRGGRSAALRLHPGVACERIAGGPGADCFFGYFGLQPWSADGRRYLFHRLAPERPDRVEICVHERDGGGVRIVGESRAFSFQQGSMALWLHTADGEAVAFNDAVDGRLACRIVAPEGGRERVIDWPLQALHPAGAEALSLNYRRLARLRPEYGYAPEAENFSPHQPLADDGLWRVDLASGAARLVVSLAELAAREPRPDMASAEHKLNHACYSPAGTRIVFMHRWFGARGKFSRLYVAAADGSALRLLLDDRMVSHVGWRDEDTLLAWARTAGHGDHYYLIDVARGEVRPLGIEALETYGDGHPSWSADGRWILTDSYPDRGRMRRLLLCEAATGRVIEVGAFHSPWKYDGARRCDLHPRWSPDGRRVSIDSSHEGFRGTYAVDVGALVEPPC